MLRSFTMHGVVVVDKSEGPTSHDVVAQLRRALKTRKIGHAGTLDPLASGVLVLAVGEGTKLVPYLTLGDKTYEAVVEFGRETLSLDAGSEVVRELPIGGALREDLVQGGPMLQAALKRERERVSQVPPAVSAIHIEGERAHARVRRGEVLDMPPREVAVRSLELCSCTETTVTVRLTVTKGYYVRAFARDLAHALGTVAHLRRLRRLQSGGFTLEHASTLAAPTMLPIEDAARLCLPEARLTAEGEVRAKQGKVILSEHWVHSTHMVPPEGYQAWFNEAGTLIAVGNVEQDVGKVVRGFTFS